MGHKDTSGDGKDVSRNGDTQGSLSGDSGKPTIILTLILSTVFTRALRFIDEEPKVGAQFPLTGD